jgi:hypothetical protein
MLKLDYKLRINSKIRARCERHRIYDPSIPGRDVIENRCATCKAILDLYCAKLALEKAAKIFGRHAQAWEGLKKERT